MCIFAESIMGIGDSFCCTCYLDDMKRVFSFAGLALMAVFMVFSCTKVPGDGVPDGGGNPGGDVNDEVEVEYAETLVAPPAGDTLAFDVDLDGDWKIVPVGSSEWVSVKVSSGAGSTETAFIVKVNETGEERSMAFSVMTGEEESFRLLIRQSPMVMPLNPGELEFLKWLVDNEAYGENTPEVKSWFIFDPKDFPCINFDVDSEGKYYITDIDMRASEDNAGMLFNSFPPEIRLQQITSIYINYTAMGTGMADVNCPLKGSEFPSVWDCPKLERVHLECVGMVGVIPQSFADLPSLRGFFVRSCDLYGALPQKWASDKFESVVIGFNGSADCPNLGYMVPAQLDIILNSDKPNDGFHNDRNEYKLGGYRENWVGYEEGWGQERYERFDSSARKGNMTEWSSYRIVSKGTEEENAVGGIRNPLGTSDVKFIDSWESYYTNVYGINREMVKWNQAEAEAYTAEAAKRERLYTR